MKSNYKTYIAEGALIIFSVLFALFINKLFDDYKTRQTKEIALESINKEIRRNHSIIEKWKVKHTGVLDRIKSIVDGRNDSIKEELMKNSYLDLFILTNQQSLIDEFLTNTAWESAKSIGIISEFDFETTQALTRAYSMQEILTDGSLANILNYYFDSDAHEIENIDKILLQFYLRFIELTGQEYTMVFLYEKAIEELEK